MIKEDVARYIEYEKQVDAAEVIDGFEDAEVRAAENVDGDYEEDEELKKAYAEEEAKYLIPF